MKKLLIILLFISAFCNAQNLQQEINEQVWKPFISGLSNHDTDLFMSVHSKDLVRSSRDSKTVLGWDEYYKSTAGSNEWSKANNSKTVIELHFTERLAQGGLAIEVGIYKTSSTMADGRQRSFFGRFHVALRKEAGTWKILVDTDSSEGRTISEKEFLAAKAME